MLLLVLHPEKNTNIETYANLLGIPFHRLSVSGLCFKFLHLIHSPNKIIHFKDDNDYLEGAKNFRHFKTVSRSFESVNVIYPILKYDIHINNTNISLHYIRIFNENL